MNDRMTKTESRLKAFTIIELLVVIAILGVLAGIFFGVAGGVQERSRISRAESDLSLLAQYLEQYKAHYGDFPHVTAAESNHAENGILALYNALNGLRSIDGNTLNPRQRAFIDRSKFRFEFSPPNPADPELGPAVLIDPWGQNYRYYYDKASTSWENPGYVLYSIGPDGQHQAPNADGYADRSHQDNIDNIYAR